MNPVLRIKFFLYSAGIVLSMFAVLGYIAVTM